MFKMKGTKRSLLMSALALLLCVSMLIGSTFAWFTDSVTSAGNIIKSGTLDISMKWADGKESPATASWKNAADGAIFNYDKWEPGYTEARHIAVKNEGTLALKYQLTIVPTGEVSKLADVIDVYYIKTATQLDDRADLSAYKPVGTLAQLINNEIAAVDVMPNGKLAADEGFVATLVLKMREDAGNEYQGLSIGTSFSVQLLATQLTYEDDSFNNQYDKDAVYGDVMVSSDAELKAAIEDPAMKVIAVNGDLTYDWGGESYENSKALYMKGKTFLGANDAASITFAGYGSANPIVNATFKDITIKDITKGDNESSWEHGYLEFKNLTAVNVTFANSIMMEGDFATFKNCSFNSNKDGEYAVWVANGDATFEGCTFTGPRGVKVHEAYGSEVGTVVIDNNTFAGLTQKPGVVIGTVDATTKVTIKNSTFVNCQAGDQGLYIYETDTDVANFNFKVEKNTVLNNATIVSTNATGLAEAIAKGGVVFIATDIDMNNAWTSVVPANGLTILGNGHTITNLNQPLLAGKGGPVVTVKGLTIADSNVGIAANENGLGSGAFMAFADWGGNLVFEDCHLLNSTVTGNERAAAFIGYSIADVTIKNCSVEGSTIKAVGSTAGLIGHANGTTTIENSSVKNTKVTATEDRTGKAAVAGAVVGTISNNTAFTNVTASNNTVSNTGATPVCDEVGRIVSGNWIVDGVSYKLVAEGLFVNPASEENDWFVLNAAGLAELNAKMVNKTAGKNAVVNLISDIDFAGKTWITVDSHADTAFSLKEINGNGHTISNLTVNGQAMFSRFSGVGDVVIKDVTFENANINSNGSINTAILTGHTYQNVLLDNVDVKNSTITGGYKVAPLIGTVYNEKESTVTATLKNCDVDNVVVTATSYDFCTTGMVAFVYADNNDKIEFENCTVSNVKLYAPNVYTAHAAIYTTGSDTLFNEAEGVVVTNVSFENK